MSWTHSICTMCWNIQHPERAIAISHLGETEHCCFCGSIHDSGIYVREAPAELWCKGEKGIHVNHTH